MKDLIVKWNKKILMLLNTVLFVAFIIGCTYQDDYYYQADDTEYEAWNDGYVSSNVGNGTSGDEDISKGNSGITDLDIDYSFRNENLLESHYEKHGEDMGFSSPEEYEDAANDVIDHEDTLHKTEAEDGDDVYYREETNEFVVVSQDGYIRTYFYPNDGIDYFNRQ